MSHLHSLSQYPLRFIVCLAAFVVITDVPARLFAQEKSDSYTLGLRALNEKKYADAARHMTYTLKSVKSKRAEAVISFYIGLARQRQAQGAEGDVARSLLEQSKNRYQQAVNLEPRAGGALNNLAEVLTSLKDFDHAAKYYREAINLVDHRQPMYLTNYAQFLANREHPQLQSAIRMYELAIEHQEDSRRARDGILQIWRRQDADGFIAHVWKLARNGRQRLAQVSVLEAVETRVWTESQYEGLASCFAWCQSKQNLSPETFLNTKIAALCRKLSEHEVLGPGMRQLIEIHSAENLKSSAFQWWANKLRPTGSARFGLEAPAQESFGQLIISLGDLKRDRKDFDLAEKYYMLAYKLAEDHLDASALVRLADMWVSNKQNNKLQQLFRKDEHRLFDQKAQAIAAVEHKRAYELHRALAVIYVHLGEWESETRVRSAVFQLRTALEDAQKHNRQVKLRNGSDFIVDQRLATTLAKWYLSKNDTVNAFRTRVKWAVQFNSLGRVDVARDLIPPTLKPPTDADTATVRRYDKLIKQFSTMKEMGWLKRRGKIHSEFLPGKTHSADVMLMNDQPLVRINLWVPQMAGLADTEITYLKESVETALQNQAHTNVRRGGLQLLSLKKESNVIRIHFDGEIGSIHLKKKKYSLVKIPFAVKQNSGGKPIGKFDFARQ